VGNFSSIELDKKLAGKRARVSPFIGTFEEGLRGGGSPEDLETTLQLAHLYVTAPRKDADAFGAMRQRMAASLVNRASNPNMVYGDSLGVTLSSRHPWSTPLAADELAGIDLDLALAFYRERFADVGDLTWVFVGNLDLDVLRPLVEQYVATLPATGREETWRDPGIRAPEGPLHKVVRTGVDEKARTTLVMHGDFEWTRPNRAVLGALGQALRIRLREVIREEMSGTYGIQVAASPDRIPESEWQMRISFAADPHRLDELVAEVLRVLAEVRESGLDASYVEKVREQQRREYEEGLRRNDYWMSNLAFRERHGIDQREQLETLAVIDALDAAAVAEAAKKYLPIERVIRVDMMPENWEAPGK
jgi:zinc protease